VFLRNAVPARTIWSRRTKAPSDRGVRRRRFRHRGLGAPGHGRAGDSLKVAFESEQREIRRGRDERFDFHVLTESELEDQVSAEPEQWRRRAYDSFDHRQAVASSAEQRHVWLVRPDFRLEAWSIPL